MVKTMRYTNVALSHTRLCLHILSLGIGALCRAILRDFVASLCHLKLSLQSIQTISVPLKV
jgi:hypothetical protein